MGGSGAERHVDLTSPGQGSRNGYHRAAKAHHERKPRFDAVMANAHTLARRLP